MRTDFENLRDGDKIKLYPNKNNPLHKSPVVVTYNQGFFLSQNAKERLEGSDYYWGDVTTYNDGFDVI